MRNYNTESCYDKYGKNILLFVFVCYIGSIVDFHKQWATLPLCGLKTISASSLVLYLPEAENPNKLENTYLA